jgi:hypothetical protein
MKIKTISLAILASAHLLTANAGPVTAADHAFDVNAPDVNKYNLDMTQDNISAGNFMYCRWGTLCDQQLANGLPVSLQFDYLTPPPSSQSSRDLFILASGTADDQFQLSSFQNQWPLPSASSSWTTPLGPGFTIFGDPISVQPGQVQPDSPQNGNTYFLFRKHEFSPVLFEWQNPNLEPRLDQNASKLIIMIHGWNRSQNYDNYQQDADFINLGTSIHNQISGTDWKLVGYHWEADADTGSAVFGSRPNWGVLNGAEAAEAGYLHGLHLGQVLLNNYTNVQKVQFIAHSAGAWVARTAAKYLMQRNPGIKVQVTLLDPYVPGAVSPADLDPIDLPSTSLTDDRINELLNFGSSAYQLENYYSEDGFAIAGTQETFWGGGGVDWSSMAINEQVGTSVIFVTTDRYGGHSGPIQFYSDTVSNTLASPPPPSSRLSSFGGNLQKIGWWRSMFLDEMMIDQQPTSVTGATQGQPVSFTAHATTRREQRGYSAPGLTLSYHWQKYDDASATWQTAFGSSATATYSLSATVAGDAGQYRVIADNGAGQAISQVFTLSFDAGSPQISLQSPIAGATVSGTVAVTTTVSGAVGIVKFYVDGTLKTTDSSSPFSWSWDSTQILDGLHTLTAKAYDSLGTTLLGVSAPVTVTVNNGSGSIGNLDPFEPNDSFTQAALLPLNTNIQAYISSPSDVDWFKVSVTNFGTLQLNLSVPASKDFDLELYGPNGKWQAGSYHSAGFSESIQQTITTTGTYYFRVYGYPLGAGDYSPASAYALSTSFVPQTTTNIVSGGVTNSTWSGIVNLTGDVTIGSGSVLTILPGTLIQCQPDTDSQAGGANSSRVEIIVNGGTLHALGTAGTPIVFTSAGPTKTPGDWYGIRIIEGDITMSNCVVEYASDGMRFEDSDTRFNNYALGNVTVQRCSGNGVWTTSGQYASVTLNNFQLWTNSTGLNANGPVTLNGGQSAGNGSYGVLGNSATLAVTGTTVSGNGYTGVYQQNGSAMLTSCVVTNNHGDGVFGYGTTLQVNGCSILRNNGWGVNAYQGGTSEIWNCMVQSNGSGGLNFDQITVGVVGNTISGNFGTGLQISRFGVSASGITGNVITGNAGVGVEVSSYGTSPLTISGNDIYQNTNFELRNDSSSTIIATNEYWGEPTTSEVNAGQVNLSRIYDSHDNASSGQVLVQSIRTSSQVNTLKFVQQPQSVTPNVGDTVTLAPVVAGVGPISYQWFDNGLLMPQGTNLTLTMPGVTVGNSGGYFLVISNVTGTAISSVAFVAVILPPGAPTISQQPQPRSVLAGSPVSFTVVAAGTGPFGYQWQKDSVAINGATSSTYTIAAVSVNDTGAYSVIVTNSGGSTPSQAATLTVNVLSGSAINRSITTNGSNFAVSLVVSPPVGTPAYMVEEVLPAGFSPNNISSSGSWDATSRTITWGPFWDGLPRSFTYTLVPPNGFSGTASLTGEALLFGATATTGGDSNVTVGPPPMNPILALVKIAPGLYGVSVTGEIGRTYRIDAADNLGSGAWSPIITVVVTQSPFTIADLGSIGKSMRFYRAVVQ